MVLEPEKSDKRPAESKILSIQIESSPSLILEISQLFRSHKQPQKAVELCRQGLADFPGDLRLRLALALGYLDLNQKEEAWLAVRAVAEELHQLSPVLEKIAAYTGRNEQTGLAEWLSRFSRVLAQYPGASQETSTSSPTEREGTMEFFAQKDSGTPAEGDLISESNVLSTLDSWVTQLKK